MNKINYSYLKKEKLNNIEEEILEYDWLKNITYIEFELFNNTFNFDYIGLKVIETINTNKFIKNLLYRDYFSHETNIKINGYYVKQKDVIIISDFTKISDILNDKSNGNLHNFLKDNGNAQRTLKIENEIVKIYEEINYLNNVIDLDLSKSDIINFIDIKDDFVNEKNILTILEIMKVENHKKLIIFNDVNLIKYQYFENLLNYFDFLYIVNSINESKLNNFQFLCVKHSNNKLIEKID